MKVPTIVYHGAGPTQHPELGVLVPGELREIPERDLPAALAALGAGLDLEVRVDEAEPLEAGVGQTVPVVQTSAYDGVRVEWTANDGEAAEIAAALEE